MIGTMTTNDETTENASAQVSPGGASAEQTGGGGEDTPNKARKIKKIEFRVNPEEAEKLKERASEASMTVSEFCRRASSGKRIISRYDYDVIRRLAELHGDQARLGNLFKMALDMEPGVETTGRINSILSNLSRNQELITYILKEVSEA